MEELGTESKRTSRPLIRFISVESSKSSTDGAYNNSIQTTPNWEHSFTSLNFLLKVTQIVVSITCLSLYSKGSEIITNSVTTLMFPNFVFGSYIIITGVIIFSYILGYIMPDLITRIFNTIGAILNFITTILIGYFWITIGRYLTQEQMKANLLLTQVLFSGFNTLFYGFDVILSIKHSLRNVE